MFIADNAPRTEIIMSVYKDSLPRGMAVTISVRCNKTFTLSCENKSISFKVRLSLNLF